MNVKMAGTWDVEDGAGKKEKYFLKNGWILGWASRWFSMIVFVAN